MMTAGACYRCKLTGSHIDDIGLRVCDHCGHAEDPKSWPAAPAPTPDFTVLRAGVRLDLELTHAPATALPTTGSRNHTVTVDPDTMVVHVLNGDVIRIEVQGFVVGLHNVVQGSDWMLTGPNQARPPAWTHPILRQLADDNQWRLVIPE